MKFSSAASSVRQHAADPLSVAELRDAGPLWFRRASFIGPVLGSAALGTWLGVEATAGVESPLRPFLLALLAINLLYMALTGWPGVLGFILHLCGRRFRAAAAPSGLSRTALVMPVYNEDPATVFAAMSAMARAVAEARLRRIDLFVLSDTQDAAIAAAEEAEFTRAQAGLPPGVTLHYRRRAQNSSRKVGNLLDFCGDWGTAYDYMIVLDADSLLGVSTISNLIGLMDANPRTGIVQTVPYAVGRETVFARMQQFSARLYTPLLVEGLTFWQQGHGNYWGHNAIIRIAPYLLHCALPVLPGKEPFGGEILCHDVVEAGLMRGAGWDVWVLPEPMESLEAVPANMVDFAVRERRWCQGNLQHTGVLPDKRLRAMGRFHLGYGILHYLAAPCAVLFLLLATLDAALGGGFARQLLLADGWAQWSLIGLGAAMLYTCKLTTLAAVLADSGRSRRFGGRWRLLAGAALEQVGALVITAVLIVAYTRYVFDLLRGATVRWEAQPRDDRGLSWNEAWTRFRLPTAAGAVWLAALAWVDTGLMWWCAPFLFGLLASVPFAVLSSRLALGRAVRGVGLFLTPEEAAPPAVLRAFQRALAPAPVPSKRPRATAAVKLGARVADGA